MKGIILNRLCTTIHYIKTFSESSCCFEKEKEKQAQRDDHKNPNMVFT